MFPPTLSELYSLYEDLLHFLSYWKQDLKDETRVASIFDAPALAIILNSLKENISNFKEYDQIQNYRPILDECTVDSNKVYQNYLGFLQSQMI